MMVTTESRIVFAVSSRASAWRALDWWQSLGHDAGRLALDLDLTGRLRRHRLGLDSWSAALERPDVVSVWIRTRQVTTLVDQPHLDSHTDHQMCLPRRTIVIAHDAIIEPDGDLNDAIASARRLQSRVDTSTRVALAVAPVNPSGGREHLIHLQTLRHHAAEWDIDLALDLTGGLDETWEAEAAMLRIAKRLAIIRLAYPGSSSPGSPAWRLRRRILVAAADLDFAGVVAIAPALRPWHWPSSTGIALDLRQAVVDVRTAFRNRAAATGEPLHRREAG